jgi:hypothetical protein
VSVSPDFTKLSGRIAVVSGAISENARGSFRQHSEAVIFRVAGRVVCIFVIEKEAVFCRNVVLTV